MPPAFCRTDESATPPSRASEILLARVAPFGPPAHHGSWAPHQPAAGTAKDPRHAHITAAAAISL
jgi:hypothetical protein